MKEQETHILSSSFPSTLEEFIGQEKAIETLTIAVGASKILGTALPHVLIYGPAGLGKTTLAACTANTIGAPIYYAVGNKISGMKDVDDIVRFISMRINSVVFIDEVHAMPKKIEEVFFPLMQDFNYNGTEISPFTMFGATTNAGDVIKPMRDRFKYTIGLQHYSDEAIFEILMKNETIEEQAARMIAGRAFGIPRIAKNYLIQCRDQAVYDSPFDLVVREEDVIKTMERLEIDEEGIGPTQRKMLRYLYECGCPVGLETIAMVLDVDIDNLKELSERILMYKEYIMRTRSGRKITKTGKLYMEERGAEHGRE